FSEFSPNQNMLVSGATPNVFNSLLSRTYKAAVTSANVVSPGRSRNSYAPAQLALSSRPKKCNVSLPFSGLPSHQSVKIGNSSARSASPQLIASPRADVP